MATIPFNLPYLTGRELEYIEQALRSHSHAGNGPFTHRVRQLLSSEYGMEHVFLTPSCTAALEMGAILMGLGPGDEVILPSYTFSSTANAVVLQGARPVFCEVTPDTMNVDVEDMLGRITARTKALVPIDYAGIPCDSARIGRAAEAHGLQVMVDAAQSFGSKRDGQWAGTNVDLAAFSFHATKNISCGEGGALVVGDAELAKTAEMVQEKGTDRSLVLRGVQSKYGWVTKGSSFLMSEISAAMLLASLESVHDIALLRSRVTKAYRELFEPYVTGGVLTIPVVPTDTVINHHAFFVIFDTAGNQEAFIRRLRERDVNAYIGYTPLHSSKMGRSLGFEPEDLPITEDLASRIVRLPFYADLGESGLERTIEVMARTLHDLYPDV